MMRTTMTMKMMMWGLGSSSQGECNATVCELTQATRIRVLQRMSVSRGRRHETYFVVVIKQQLA